VSRRLICRFVVLLSTAGCAQPQSPQDDQPRVDAAAHDRVNRVDLAPGPPSDLSSDLASGGACVDGGGCTTVNPGACHSGHIVCKGNAAECVPDLVMQSCYTGPAATLNVGVCQAGTQSCTDALGSCEGEVTPSAVEFTLPGRLVPHRDWRLCRSD
jgi:hypothetical protein